MTRKSAIKDWMEAIAQKAKVDLEEVEATLTQHRIEPMPVASSPKHLLVNRVRFAGTKNVEGEELPVDFEWANLDTGLWAIMSDENFRGKSTIIEVIRGCLRGSLSETLQDDVNKWLQLVDLDFQVDDRNFELRIDRSESSSGRLSQITRSGQARKVHSFEDEDELEAAMSNFFMKQFSFDRFAVSRTQNETASTVLHGWPAMCSALFIRTKYDTIIGELPSFSGVPLRLFQLFLGVPWATTLAAASTALKQEESRDAVANQKHSEAKESIQQRMNDLQSDLADKKAQLEKTKVTKSFQAEFDSLGKSLHKAMNEELTLQAGLRRASADFENATVAVNNDRSELRRHEEESSAQTVFRALDPKACPRCETSISETKKKSEKVKNACAVCGEKVYADVDEAEIKRRLEDRLEAAQKGKRSARKRVKDLNTELDSVRERIETAVEQQQKLAKRIERPTKRSTLLTEVAGLEARIDELSKTLPAEPSISTDSRILKVIERVTKERMKEHQDGLLLDISEKICEYARRFGMPQLEMAKLDGALNLRVKKGGGASSYSKLTDGEKLRLKVATVLAMIHVGEQTGVGRYPGLLVLDSPASQEVTEKDLEQIMAGVAEIAEKIPHIQVIVASTTSAAISKHIPPERRREAMGLDYLW